VTKVYNANKIININIIITEILIIKDYTPVHVSLLQLFAQPLVFFDTSK